jgi:hypothetical protein
MKKLFLLFVTATVLLATPKLNFGQVPSLGSASSFALFTAAGAFDNVGAATYVTGDVGTNIGAFNAFPTGTVAGQTHVVDATSAEAATNVDVVYSYLSEITGSIVIGTTLGDNQVLTPNTYSTGAASTLNGDITLDGGGDPNAVFIFQIDGAFETGISSHVILINSASLKNVYWQINGKFELGNNSVFRGNIVASGAITLLEGSSLLGRGLTRAGAISLHNNIVTLEDPSLPIELLSFTVKPENNTITISWATTSETNNNYFTVEKFDESNYYETVVIINGAGNSNSLLNYTAIDIDPSSGVSYYRLKQTDFDGKFSYSNLVKVDFEKSLDINIYPNPFITNATIMITDASQMNNYELRIYDVLGTEVMNTIIIKQLTAIETNNLPSGIYSYNVFKNDKNIQSGKLISQQ